MANKGQFLKIGRRIWNVNQVCNILYCGTDAEEGPMVKVYTASDGEAYTIKGNDALTLWDYFVAIAVEAQ